MEAFTHQSRPSQPLVKRSEGGVYRTQQAGIRLLQGQRRCVVWTIIGPMRTGKSYLPSLIMNEPGLFVSRNRGAQTQVSHTRRAISGS